MEAASLVETLVTTYQTTTMCHNAEDKNPNLHCCENLNTIHEFLLVMQ